MSGGFHEIRSMLAEKRVLAALHWLESTRAANPRVWGLDQEIDRLQAIQHRSQELIERADRLLARDEATAAYPLLKKAQLLVADNDELNQIKSQTKSRIARAREDYQQAVTWLQGGNAIEALKCAESAVAFDATDQHMALVNRIKHDSQREQRLNKMHRRGIAASLAAGLLFMILIGYMIWSSDRQAKVDAEQGSIVSAAQTLLNEGFDRIRHEQYVEAKSNLEEASRRVEGIDTPDAAKIREQVDATIRSEAIVEGTAGRVPFEGRWVPREERERALADRATLRSQVQELEQLVRDYLGGQLKGVATVSFEKRQSLRALLDSIREVDRQITDRRFDDARASYVRTIESCESLFRDSGLVKYKEQWMTAEAAEDAEMTSRGLVKYESQWVTPEEKERREMTAKGLVQYDGKWVTPERREELQMLAKGLVRYGNDWVTPAEKERREMTKTAENGSTQQPPKSFRLI